MRSWQNRWKRPPCAGVLRFAVPGAVVRIYSGYCLLVLSCTGCGTREAVEPTVDSRVASMASQWPEYRAPVVLDGPVASPVRPVLAVSREAMPSSLGASWGAARREEWGIEQTAEDSLARIGEAAVPALVKSLSSPDREIRLRAAMILARIGPDATSAVPALVERLQDPSPPVRKAAARALGQIGPTAADAVEPLLEVMQHAELRPVPSPSDYD